VNSKDYYGEVLSCFEVIVEKVALMWEGIVLAFMSGLCFNVHD
jgi:hypothetical protein